MIEQLARALRRAGIETDAVQLAEILWVAIHRTPGPARTELVTAVEGVPGTPPVPHPPGPTVPGPAAREEEPAARPMYLVPPRPVPGEAVEVRLPAPVALPERLRLGRALRVLKRRYPAPRLREFDLDATVELYGDTGLLVPLLRPGSERWFDVILVVDAGPTMDVWAQTTAELAKLLAGHGAFRRVRRLRLIDDEGEPWLLTDSGVRRHPRRAVGREARQLIMVISDCVGPPWSGEALWAVLREWGRHSPVVLVQTLPRRLWESTALGPADVRVSAYRPGQPNSGLRVARPWWLMDEEGRGEMLPVVALTEPDLTRWARMVLGSAAEPVAAVPAGPAWAEAPTPAALPEVSAPARVATVKATISVEAYELAVCLAAVPIRLPVARIVQYAVLGSRDPIHLAEVFASGLVQRLTPLGADVSPDEVTYDFVPGVRAVLQESLTGARTLEIFRAVAHYLERTIGASASFAALLTGETGEAELDPQFLPFAEVGAPLLDRLGLRAPPLTDDRLPGNLFLEPGGLPWAHAILIGHHEMEEFLLWLTDTGLPPDRITWVRGDFDRDSFRTAVRAAARRPNSGPLFLLMRELSPERGSSAGLVAEVEEIAAAEAFSAMVTVILEPAEVSIEFSSGPRPFANLLLTGVPIAEVILALAGAAGTRRGEITAASFGRYLSRRARSSSMQVFKAEQIVLNRASGRVPITRRRALVVGLQEAQDEARVFADRLVDVGYEVEALLGDVAAGMLSSALDRLISTAEAGDLLWVHISAARGMAETDDGVQWQLADGRAVRPADIVDAVAVSGAGAVVVTDETRDLDRFHPTQQWQYAAPAKPRWVRVFLRISNFVSRDRLVPRLVEIIENSPHLIELRDLAGDPRLSKRSVTRRGELAIPIAADPADVILADLQLIDIPAGEFFSGHTEAQLAERSEDHGLVPGRSVFLPGFAISRFPITNRQYELYRREVNLQREPVPEELGDHPVTWITWSRAKMYCRWLAGKTGLPIRLPTALEWEKAARGTDGRRFPWGDEFDPARVSYRRRTTVPVRQFSPAGDSPYGVADTVGNVREWTSTVLPEFEYAVVCGGGMHASDESALWCTSQVAVAGKPRASIGLRVALTRP